MLASGRPEEITDRGRVVAVLSPPPRASGIARLREAGATRPATGGVAAALATREDSAGLDLTAALAEQRDTER